ncbi:type II toxin-antitoxin system RelE/ParE family toxin [Candidatus Pacearchaeota archaeon]|nr:type II toxin-antitoxin system RelE/ParE family toxin [Candidatus Pacearchaeota archaeon]
MVKVDFDDRFKRVVSKIKDASIKDRIEKLILKIRENPEIGKPMRNLRKGTREVYLRPFRLSYAYNKTENIVIILDFYHKDEQ